MRLHLIPITALVLGPAVAACGPDGVGDAALAQLDATATTVTSSTPSPSTPPPTTVTPTTTTVTPTTTTVTPTTTEVTPTTTEATPTTTEVAPAEPTTGIVDGKLVLPLIPEVGQAARTRIIVETEQTLTDPVSGTITVSSTTSVTSERRVTATDGRTHTVSETIVDVTLESSDNSTAQDELAAALESAIGTEVIITFDLRGTEIGREVVSDGTINPFAEALLGFAPRMTIETPAGGVAVGDTWTTTVSGDSLNMPVDLVIENTLTSLDERFWAAETAATIDAGELLAGAGDEVTGTMTVAGTTGGRVDHALIVNSESVVTVEAEITIDGETGTIRTLQAITQVSEEI